MVSNKIWSVGTKIFSFEINRQTQVVFPSDVKDSSIIAFVLFWLNKLSLRAIGTPSLAVTSEKGSTLYGKNLPQEGANSSHIE